MQITIDTDEVGEIIRLCTYANEQEKIKKTVLIRYLINLFEKKNPTFCSNKGCDNPHPINDICNVCGERTKMEFDRQQFLNKCEGK